MQKSFYLNNQGVQLSQGRIFHTDFEHKFGAVPSMTVNTSGTIWDKNDTYYPWEAFDSAGAGPMLAKQVDADDNGKSVNIFGLNENFEEQSAEITVSSSQTTPIPGNWSRVFRAYVSNGSETNIGNIDLTKEGIDVLRINAGQGQSLMAVYTVPAGWCAYIMKGVSSIQKGGDATVFMYVRYGGIGAWRVGHTFEVSDNYQYEFYTPIPIPEKTDIDLRADVRTNNARITAAWDMILYKK